MNLAQVLPESKGVVVLAVRGSAKDYKGVDPFTGAILNRENAKTYWLCRNGENLYRIWADIQVGGLLYPQSNAAVSRFKPGSREYYQSLKRAGKGQKDFLRNGLVLQGLIDRTRRFHRFKDGVLDRNCLIRALGWGLKFLSDAEYNLGEGRPSFTSWLSEIKKGNS